jgi:hypothetical protein
VNSREIIFKNKKRTVFKENFLSHIQVDNFYTPPPPAPLTFSLAAAVSITDRERHEKAVDIALRTKLPKEHSVHLGKLGTHNIISLGYKYKAERCELNTTLYSLPSSLWKNRGY